jgi:hypothetical protein
MVLVEYDVILRLLSSQIVNLSDNIALVEKGVTAVSGTFVPFSTPVVNSTVQHVQLVRKMP